MKTWRHAGGKLGLDALPGAMRQRPSPGQSRVRGIGLLRDGHEDRGALPLPQPALDQVGQDLPASGARRPDDQINQRLVIGGAQKLKTLFCAALRIQ